MSRRLLAQEERSESTIAQQPKTFNSRINIIMAMDIAGATRPEIASALDLTPMRITQIQTSPLYQERVAIKREELAHQTIDKTTSSITEDTVKGRLLRLAPKAVSTYADLLSDGESEAVRKSVADEILDRTGYKAAGEKTTVTVQMTDKMASRLERVMGLSDGLSEPQRVTEVSVTKEISS